MIWYKGELIKKNNVVRTPRTAEEEVELADIFEPFSISKEPLFQDMIPCCIHLGKFSYASCNLPNKSRAVEALFASIAILTLSLNIA